jgi:metal-responsive CopG/Arc/MetJ family transcriptional regulator
MSAFDHSAMNGAKSLGLRRATAIISRVRTSVSIPDDVFEEVERLARRRRRSRSAVYTAALREYIARYSPDEITEAINRVVDEVEQETEFVNATARRILKDVEW